MCLFTVTTILIRLADDSFYASLYRDKLLSTKLCWLERETPLGTSPCYSVRSLLSVTDIEFDWYMRVTLLSTELHVHTPVRGVWNAEFRSTRPQFLQSPPTGFHVKVHQCMHLALCSLDCLTAISQTTNFILKKRQISILVLLPLTRRWST